MRKRGLFYKFVNLTTSPGKGLINRQQDKNGPDIGSHLFLPNGKSGTDLFIFLRSVYVYRNQILKVH